jgi:hypothetical protein
LIGFGFRAVAEVVIEGYSVNFVKTGNPDGADPPHRPAIQARVPKSMVLSAEPHPIEEPHLRQLLLLQSIDDGVSRVPPRSEQAETAPVFCAISFFSNNK